MATAVWDVKSNPEFFSDNNVFDCMIAEFLLSAGTNKLSQEEVCRTYGVSSVAKLAVLQQKKLSEHPLLNALFHTIEMPLASVLWRMEKTGIMVDADRLQNIGIEINQAIAFCEKDLKHVTGPDLNLNSNVQLGDFLVHSIGVPLSKTRTGKYATNESELEQYAKQFPILQHILHYRELRKLQSTYVDSLIQKVSSDKRIHTTYSQVATSTGRLASSNPNMQNIPVQSEFGQKIKDCFVASPGKTLVSFDYSQQELRILAHVSQEEKLIEAFRNKRDIHATTASQIFHCAYDAVTKEQRSIAKTINFGIIYGMGSYGMSLSLGIPVEEASGFINTFYTTYPNIRTYFEKYLKNGKTNGYVETLLGRRKNVFENPKQTFIDNATRRVLINFPIQGSAADLMRKTMVEIYDSVVRKHESCQLLLQIHDDLVFEIEDEKKVIPDTVSAIRNLMCTVYPLLVPIEVEVKMGKSWGTMHKIEYGV